MLIAAGGFNACLGSLGFAICALAVSVGVDIEAGDTYAIKMLFLYPSFVWLATSTFCFSEKYRQSSRFRGALVFLNGLPVAVIFGLLVYESLIWAQLSPFVVEHTLDMMLLLFPVLAVHALNICVCRRGSGGRGQTEIGCVI
jgi:hypothetical protein